MRSFSPAWMLASAALLSCRSVPGPTDATGSAAPGGSASASGGWTRTPPPGPLAMSNLMPPATTGFVLPNGLRVVVVEQHRRPVAVVSLVLPRGALADPPSDAGLTYMAVSLASDFYEVSDDGNEIDEEKSFRRQVTELGGSAWFHVASDYSMVRISGYAQDAREYLNFIASAVMKPRHGRYSFRGRRNAALDDIEDVESSDPEALQQLVSEAAFGQGHPYARSVIGTTETLKPLGLEDVITHQQAVLVPQGATLLIVGDVRADQVIAAARASFGRWMGTGETLPAPRVVPPAVPNGNAPVVYLERRSASTLVACATRPLSDVSGSDAALDVLATVVGSGTGSRLGATLREQNGLTYGASAEIVRRRQARAFVACSALRADQADLGVRLFRQVLDRAREQPPSAEEVERAKGLRLAELESSYDSALGTTQTWLRAITLGPGSPRPDEERAQIDRVTPADVQRLARAILNPRTTRWVLSGTRVAAARAVDANGLGPLRRLEPGR